MWACVWAGFWAAFPLHARAQCPNQCLERPVFYLAHGAPACGVGAEAASPAPVPGPVSDCDCLLGSCDRIVVDVGWFGALGHGDFGGGGRIPPMSAMSMGATERDRSRFQRRPMALCDREGLSGSTHGSRLVCLRGIRAIVALWRFGCGQTILKTVCLG